MSAKDKVARLLQILADGKTIYITSYGGHTTAIMQKHVLKFREMGREILKAKGESLFLSSGNRYDCIDYCKIMSD